MRSHIAIRTLRDEHGFKHHADTLLHWRHQFLAFMAPNPSPQLAGLIEADEKCRGGGRARHRHRSAHLFFRQIHPRQQA